VTVGGGLGSFALVDLLRVLGVSGEAVAILGPYERPYETLRHLCRTSQIADDDPLRSDSGSRVDNVWGFPGYALEESIRRRTLRPLWQVAVEPVLGEPYTPHARLVYAGLDREAARIGWTEMLARGRALLVRPRRGGGYFVLFLRRAEGGGGVRPVVYRSRFAHLALGHPGIQLLPDVRSYRASFGDYERVVAAYEAHEHVYAGLATFPGTVVVRGAGITASRILQRLIDDRDSLGAETEIVHLFRTYTHAPTRHGGSWRDGGDGFTYQHYSFPKAATAGLIRDAALSADGDARDELLSAIGGTTTPRRERWTGPLARGRREGWYRAQAGRVTRLRPAPGGRGVEVACCAPDGTETTLRADFMIDATGLMNAAKDHPLVADLIDTTGAAVNRSGGVNVGPAFELAPARSGMGRIYASGATVLGGSLASADSFDGMMHAALAICDDLADQGFCAHPSTGQAWREWRRWIRNRRPHAR
jgi:hypothetical protein